MMQKIIPSDSVLIPDNANCVFKGQIFDVYQWSQEMYDGTSETFEMLRRPDTVSVIGIVEDKILVLDDEQPHTGSRKSFPGGRVDLSDESTESAAQREMLEETGYSFNNWRLIKVGQPHTKIEWFVYLYLAWEVKDQQATDHDAGEKSTVHQLEVSELKNLVINKSGYLGESTEIFKNLNSTLDLLKINEYQGSAVDR